MNKIITHNVMNCLQEVRVKTIVKFAFHKLFRLLFSLPWKISFS